MNRFFQIILVLFLCSCANKNESEDVVRRVLDYEEKGEFNQALKLINEAVRMDSLAPTHFIIRGNIYLDLYDTNSAFTDFTKAIYLEPQNTSALFHKGLVFSMKAKEDSAVFYYNLALNTKESGGFLVRKVHENNVEQPYDVSIEIIRYYRAMSYVALQSYGLALSDLYYSLEYQYEEAECQYYIGTILIKQGNRLTGCDYLKKSVANGLKDGEKYLSKYCK